MDASSTADAEFPVQKQLDAYNNRDIDAFMPWWSEDCQYYEFPNRLLGQKTMLVNGQEMPVRPNLGLCTQPISFIGLPVVCVPVTSGALPCGVQIIAAPGREDLALAAATQLEKAGVVAAPIASLGDF